MPGELKIVYKAANVGEADMVVAFLGQQGIPAMVMDQHMAGAYAQFAIAGGGVCVCVLDPDQVERATKLVRAQFAPRPRPEEAQEVGDPIPAVCDECGRETDFPFEHRGTVQECPRCREFIDVPDPSAAEAE